VKEFEKEATKIGSYERFVVEHFVEEVADAS
jgi:hypothetical protein